MPASLSFKPSLWPTLAALVGVVGTAMLGDWQLNRAAHKAELQMHLTEAARSPAVAIGRDTVDGASILYRPVEIRGTFEPDKTIYVDNRVHQGRPGYIVATPLHIANSTRYVLVERGWLPAGSDRRHLPAVTTPPGEVEVKGIATPANPPVFELSKQVESGALWENLTLDRYRARYPLDLQPLIVQQHNDLADGLVRDWQPPTLGIDRHRAYALQWFSMALAILVIYVVLNVRRKRSQA